MEANIHPNCKCQIINGVFKSEPDCCEMCDEARSEYNTKQFGIKGKLKKLDKDQLPIYDIVIDDSIETGMNLISVVDTPAIETKGYYFSDTNHLSFKEAEGDQQIIVGPALVPDMLIYREDDTFGQYYVRFTKETIEKMVEKFNQFGSNRKINVDHSNTMVDAFIMEDWIIENAVYDKSRIYGFELPVGTYMIKVKINDTEFWNNEVKGNGKFGFSVEGLMGQQLISLAKEVDILSEIDNMSLEDLYNILKF